LSEMSEMSTREKVQELLRSRPELTLQQIGSFTSLATSTIRQFLRDDVKKTTGLRVDEEFERVLRLIEQGDILRPDPGATIALGVAPKQIKDAKRARDFYRTLTVQHVCQVMDYCASTARIGVITGEYGVGKTEAVSYWRRTAGAKLDHLVFEFDEFSSAGVCDFIEALADRLNIEFTGGIRNGGRTHRAVCARLRKEPMLLIFDQCESVQARVFQVIRQIWDATHEDGVGIVLLAAPLLMQRLHYGRLKDIGALTSRVGVWGALQGLSRDEVSAVLKQEGIENITEGAYDLLWRAIGGSMRRLMAVTDLLVQKHGAKTVTERTIEGVANTLWGLQLNARRPVAVAS